MRSSGLGRLISKWKGERVDSSKVTGLSGKDMNNGQFSPHLPTSFEERKILALVIEVGVLIVMGSHSYEFGGKFFMQIFGRPIRLALMK